MSKRRGGQFVSIKSNFHPDRIQFHKSEQALVEALNRYYPEFYNFEIVGDTATIRIPEPDIGSWIGCRGSIRAAITEFLGVARVRIEPFEFK